MPRRRLGVVLLVPEPAATEIQGLRRACGDPMLDRVPPHVTLVPPVNVREDDLAAALALVRAAAGESAPLALTLGPVTSFHPVSPVLYLDVGGDVAPLTALRDSLFAPPLERAVDRSFVPHVTLSAETTEERIDHAVVALVDYEAEVRIDAVHVLEEVPHHRHKRWWQPIADVPLGPPIVVGRGGLELELTISERMDPEVAAWAASEWERVGPQSAGPATVVVTARREGRPVGVLEGNVVDGVPRAERVLVGEGERGEGIARHLLTWFGTTARA